MLLTNDLNSHECSREASLKKQGGSGEMLWRLNLTLASRTTEQIQYLKEDTTAGFLLLLGKTCERMWITLGGFSIQAAKVSTLDKG